MTNRQRVNAGRRLENDIAKTIRIVTSNENNIMHNIYVPKTNGATELDLIFVHKTGIYVFESKNYNGMVTGADNEKDWEVTYANGDVYTMYNPIMQNDRHIWALSKYLNIPKAMIQSCIVFSDNCDLVRIESPETKAHVMHFASVEDYMIMQTSRPAIYTDEQVAEICQQLAGLEQRVLKPHSRIIAAFLAITLGFFGVHLGYLGHEDKAGIRLTRNLVKTVCSLGIYGIYAVLKSVFEGLEILFSRSYRDANGLLLC